MHTRTRAALLISLSATFIVLTAGPVLAQPPVPLRMSTRAQAMGGANLLSAGPIEAGYFNPAALTLNKGLHLTLAFQGSFDQDFLDLADFISNEENSELFDPAEFASVYVSDQGRAEDFRSNLEDYSSRWYTLSVDPMIGVQIGALSLSGYAVMRAEIRPEIPAIAPPAIPDAPSLKARVSSDLVTNAALGMQLGKMLRGGIALRMLQRQYSNELTISHEDMGETGDFTTKLVDEENWLDEPLSGYQVDVGGMFTLSKAFVAGGVIRGLVSGGDEQLTEGLKPELSGGIMFKPLEVLMGIPKILIKDITLEANIRDLLNSRKAAYDDIMDRLQIGAEVRIPFFQLRAGLNRGQLSLGAGFRFLVVDISASVSTFTDFELGLDGFYVPIEKRYFTVGAAVGF
ncbi:hypothetical protein ACFL6T_00085 [Candidatus Zixiibacteriota bacterium]